MERSKASEKAARAAVAPPSAAGRVHASFERSEPVPGVRLICERMPYVRSAAIGVFVDVGSRDEPDEIAGASHLLEHILFKGTARRSARQIAEVFDAAGGEINAYSSKEHTCYYARVLDDDVPMAIEVLSDIVQRALLRQEDIEAERNVVLEELAMNDDMPDDRVHELFLQAAWPNHPLGRPVIGTEKSVAAIDRGRLRGFYEEGYVPGRLIVAVAGNVDNDDAAALVRQEFGESDRVSKRPPMTAPVLLPSATYEPRDTEQVHLVWGSAGIPRNDRDRYTMSVLNALYGSGMSSRLFQEIREERGLVYAIYSYPQSYVDGGLFAVSGGMSAKNVGEVLRIVRGESAALAAGGVTDDEVERAKGHVRGGIVLSMEDPGGRMSRLGRAELSGEEIPRVDELLDRVDAVTREDVTRLAERLFGGGFVMATIGPVEVGSLDSYVEPL